jgi:hypothetical protein
MENIIYFGQFVGFWIGIFAAVLISYFFVCTVKEYYKKQRAKENQYNMLYVHIRAFIQKDPSEAYYEYIWNQLKRLGQLQYKNKQKTTFLTNEFFKKYKGLVCGSEEFDFAKLNVEHAKKRLDIMNAAKAS